MDSLDRLHLQVNTVGTWTVKLATRLDVHKQELDTSSKASRDNLPTLSPRFNHRVPWVVFYRRLRIKIISCLSEANLAQFLYIFVLFSFGLSLCF